MSDTGQKYIIKLAALHLGLHNDVEQVQGSEIVDDFLDTKHCNKLCAYLEKDTLKFETEIPEIYNANKLVIIHKNKPSILTLDSLPQSISVSSFNEDPFSAFYLTLNNIFLPLLGQDKNSLRCSKIQRHLDNLQKDLKDVILNIQNENVTGQSTGLVVINSLEQEVKYWEALGKTNSFVKTLQPLAHEFSIIDALPVNELENLLENAHNTLDDLWRQEPHYPKNRMENLLDIIANEVAQYVTKHLRNLKVWDEEYVIANDLLSQYEDIIAKWLETCRELTQIFWPSYSLHTWNDVPYKPMDLVDLSSRIQEVLNIRTIHRQITRLLTVNEQHDLDCDGMFQPFKDVDFLRYGPSMQQKWQTAKKQFEYLLQPAELTVASRLKKQLSGMNNIRQLIYEYDRYSELISRPVVKQALQTERQYLLNILKDYVAQLSQLVTTESDLSRMDDDVPPIVQQMTLMRELETKGNEIQRICENLLNDLQGHDEIVQANNEFLKDVKQQHTDLFDSWTSDVTAQIRSKKLCLKETDPVVQFSKNNKLMIVNYSSAFVNLNNEVRQLSALGYKIPAQIEEVNENAKKFLKFARELEQIAHFHNTVGDRMIPSQRPMMLISALNFSKLVQEEEVVSWRDIKSVQKYVDTLKGAVEKLANENNVLTSYHIQVTEKISQLEGIDLIKNYDKWKAIVSESRQLVLQVQQKGFQNMHVWKADLDSLISVMLEKQYLKNLDKLHYYLPEIYTDLIYKNSELQFLPGEDVLREKYEQQLKRFIDIPKNFQGISDTMSFSTVIENNQEELQKVTSHTENLFEQLKAVKKHWQGWLSLGTLDTSQLTKWQEWDLHFRASKSFGQEIAKLPSNEEKVGCFVVGLTRLRIDLESHNRIYWDQLVSSLKDSIAEDVVKLQQFIDPSTATLTKHPVTIEQITESGLTHRNIVNSAPEMESIYKEMMQKVQVLSSWSREQVDSVSRLKGAWERLKNLLENHQYIMAKQIETVKTTLNIATDNLEKDIERFVSKWEQVKGIHIADEGVEELQKRLENIREKRKLWQEIMEKKEKLESDYEKFGLPVPDFEFFNHTNDDLKKQEESWSEFEEFCTEFEKLASEEWIVFRKRIFQLEDFLYNWKNKLQDVNDNTLTIKILQEIHRYEAVLPVLKYLRGEDFTDKHWMEVFNLINIPPKPLDIVVVKDLLKASEMLVENAPKLQSLCKRAASEIVVRQALAELDQWDVQAKFMFTSHVDSNGKEVMLIKDFKEILNKIGDNQTLLQSVKNSADYDSFFERAEIWERKLLDLDQLTSSLSQIQRKWLYLEPIFSSGTLEREKTRFTKLDRDFRHVLAFLEKDPRVSSLLRFQNIKPLLENIQNQLSHCQQSLDEFLTEKRKKFPRFLFLGDEDLLEIVGQSVKEKVIQTHLKKIFVGINSIVLDNKSENIIAICSAHGEIVFLKNPVNIKEPVEDWMNVLVDEMQKSLRNLLLQCLAEGKNADPMKYPSQILCLAESINFTSKCESAIANMNLAPLLASYKAEVKHYSMFDASEGTDKSLTSFSSNSDTEGNLIEVKLKSLLLDIIYYTGVIEELIEASVTSVNDWYWQKQLRFYSNSQGDVTAKMVNAKLEYSFEYLGNYQKLVRTPLVDKCFLALTQGLHLGMGGNPYGPAGTGKTESVKALGSLLGRQVLVFNCDEGIDAIGMGRILSGLVRCGAWGCFDEFNRLDEATLSTISMYIHPIQIALKSNQQTLTLHNQQIEVNKHCGIFVTLNPAGEKYGGRNKLPDNLKQLFRPVVMVQPDHEQIARTLLYCDGYRNADIIGKKLVEVFTIASKLLSKQQHYDWGLRAIRTVLGVCGRMMRNHRHTTQVEERDALQFELNLAVAALNNDTSSKLTFSDSLKFESLVRNIFMGIQFENVVNQNFLHTLEESCKELELIVNKEQISKCLELYEQLKQRMGVAIVGPSGSGKSVIREILFHALKKSGKLINQYTLNPKAVSRTQLLGQIDSDTRQWTDGILTLYSSQAVSETSDVWSWIVCDGDIDPDWVESLNSVLDDNRLLTLPGGWRIRFGNNVNFIFETHSLTNASPATISRMGIVFLSEELFCLESYIENFIKNMPDYDKYLLEPLIREYVWKCLNWLVNEAETERSKLSLVQTALSYCKCARSKTEFVVALFNGFGCQVPIDYKEVFAQKLYEWSGDIPPNSLLLSHYNKERDIIDSYTTDPTQNVGDISDGLPLILTASVSQTIDCLQNWLQLRNEQHFLIIGERGTAKRLIVEHLVKDKSNTSLCIINCSSSLTTEYLMQKIDENCVVVNTSKGKVYRPKKSFLALYFKNIHLLKLDKWGSNILIAFIQQLITYKGFFLPSLEWVNMESMCIIGSLPPKNNISERISSLFCIYNISVPQQEDLSTIFDLYLTKILQQCLPKGKEWSKMKCTQLSNTMISIYNEVKSNFTSLDQHHYKFTPHDVTKWCECFLRYDYSLHSDVEKTVFEIAFYEALCIFGDKLVNLSERTAFVELLNNSFNKSWGYRNFSENLVNKYYVPVQLTRNLLLSKLNLEDWNSTVKRGVTLCEREGQNLKVLMTPEFLQLTANVARAVTIPQSHVCLAGRSGSGRKSSIKLISALLNHRLVTVHVNVKNDLKMAIQAAAIENEITYLLLQDYTLINDDFLSCINTLMSTGEFPGLYNAAELDSLIAGLKDDASRDNFEGNLLQYFTDRVKNNLKVFMCIEPENELLLHVLSNCPSIFENTTFIWVREWMKTTVEELPVLITSNKEPHIDRSDMYKIFESVKAIYAAPSRYVAFIQLFFDLYTDKLNAIKSKQNSLQVGVSKLTDAKNHVSELKKIAAEQEAKLAEKQTKANHALDMITNTMNNANVHKEKMELLKNETEKENEQLVKRKKEIELELAEVEPLIQEARAAVGNIKSESLSEIRSLRAPPEVIRDILEGVLRLMGIQDTSWNSMKTFLAKRGVKEDIRSFDAGRINVENRQAVERLMATKSDSFEEKAAKRASLAAAPLASWVKANVKYSRIAEKIRPLEREQNKLKQNLKNAEGQLEDLSAGLLDVEERVAKLKLQLATYTKEAAEVEIELNKVKNTLVAAEGLVEKLNEEYLRWKSQLKELSEEQNHLPVNCLLASAFISYLSNQSDNNRRHYMKQWMDILGETEFSLKEFMSSEKDRLQWHSEGLHSDQLSTENAIIILKTNMCPLLLDPTSVASRWFKTHLKGKNVETVTQNSPKFNLTLDLAVRFGKTLVIEDVESVSPSLLPILRKEFFYQGERKLININGKLVDFHNDFRLVLTSRNPKLHLNADIFAIVNVVNFTVTQAGLSDQLITRTIMQENANLEEQRKQLMQEREEMQDKLQLYQDRLLEDLAGSSGDILENQGLLKSLNETKSSSVAITAALKQSNVLQEQLETEYRTYEKICKFASSLYFAANECTKLNIFYVISVEAFTRLFLKTLPLLENVKNDEYQQEHILLQSVYKFMSKSIFKNDRLKFALHLMRKIHPKQISDTEWKVFLGNTINADKSTENVPTWIPEQNRSAAQHLQDALPEFCNSLKLQDYNTWKPFMESASCETQFPAHCALKPFQKVLVVQALRPDRLYSAITACVFSLSGLSNLNPDVINLTQVYNQTISTEPILLLTTSGNDPSVEIRELAKAVVGIEKYHEISMGEGQETKALDALKEAVQTGNWVTLKNLHLVTKWLPLLCQQLQEAKIHNSFRLWLVTEYHKAFSPVLIQQSLKVVYETPEGIKHNLLRSADTWKDRKVNNSRDLRIIFVISCIHALLQERRIYIPQGWLKWYEFSDVDLITAIKLAEELLSKQNMQMQWNYLKGLVCNAVYGGRIENEQDLRVLIAYLQQYFIDDVLSHKWRPFGLNIGLPNGTSYKDYVTVVAQLPKDMPSFFGLPENINRAWERNAAGSVITDLKDLDLTIHVSLQFNRKAWQKLLSPFMNLWKKLNSSSDFIRMEVPESHSETSPVLNFINEEFRYAIVLIHCIHKSFASLNRVVKGSIMPGEVDLLCGNSLICYKTPQIWLKVWQGPNDPSKYMSSVLNKALHIAKWHTAKRDFLSQQVNLSHLFHPEVLLAAYKQECSSSLNTPMDELILQSNWKGGSKEALQLTGLFIEGALFDGNVLRACLPNSETINPTPDCYIFCIPKPKVIEDKHKLDIPLYFTSSRQQKLMDLQISCDFKDTNKWILAGLAFLLDY